MPLSYRTLFLLDADAAFLFEIKRLDVQSSNPADVYSWLYFDKASQQLQPLTFVSMHAEGDEQHREFAQGRLRFTATEGAYSPAHEGRPLRLRAVVPPVLPPEVAAAVQAYFGAA